MLCIQLLYAQQFSVNSFFLAETDLTANTHGKRSPDGQLLEYAYTRDLARQIIKILKSRGYDAELLVPEDNDISLAERVWRVNATCLLIGK